MPKILFGTYQKELVENPKSLREKLTSDYSLLQSSDLRVEFAIKLSTKRAGTGALPLQLLTPTVESLRWNKLRFFTQIFAGSLEYR